MAVIKTDFGAYKEGLLVMDGMEEAFLEVFISFLHYLCALSRADELLTRKVKE